MARFKNLGDLIRRDRDLTKVAVIDLGGEAGPTEYTYLELDAMTVGVAGALAKRGFKRGDRIAIVSANRVEFIAAYFGIMRAGLVAVPVNYRFPKKTIHLIIEDAGAKLVFCDKASPPIVLLPKSEAKVYIEAIGRYRPTWVTAVTPMIAMMLSEPKTLAKTDLSRVEFIRMGSAPVSASLMESIHRALPKAKATNAYGTTEAGPVVFGPHPKGLKQPDNSVGYKHPKVQLRLVDGKKKKAAQGVLEMKCPALMNGYHNRPKIKPFTKDGFYITGDVLRRDKNGFHYFVGRTDDMFVSGGENIYPTDVERMLEQHPDVGQAVVIPVDDDIKGTKPVAFVIPKAGHKPTEDALKKYALENAPAYQHPRFVWFVDELPLASTNKVDRAALKRLAQERVAEAPERA